MSEIWTMENFKQGLCSIHDVGKPQELKQQVETSPHMEPLSLHEVPARRLKKDVLRAYEALGGVKYLIQMGSKDPSNFNKLLAKILPQAIEADVRHELQSRDLSTLSTGELKVMLLQSLAHPPIEGELVEDGPEPSL